MLGLMQSHGLLISTILKHAARHHRLRRSHLPHPRKHHPPLHLGRRRAPVAPTGARADETRHRPGDRVGTLAWNGYRHLEVYYAAPGMGAICHTINPRLHPDDIGYIVNHAAGQGAVRGFELRAADRHDRRRDQGPCARRRDAVRRRLDAGGRAGARACGCIATTRCWTTRTTITSGPRSMRTPPARSATRRARPGGRRACCTAIARPSCTPMRWRCRTCSTCARPSRILPVVPMFHVNAWGIPYAAALTGAALLLPGRHLDGASLAASSTPSACTLDLRRADRLARPAAAPALQRRAAGDGETHHDRRLGRAAAADRRVPRRIRRRGRARLGHDRTQPGRHLQRAEARAGRPDRRGGDAAHAEARPRAGRHRHEDRRCATARNCRGTARRSAT